MGPLPSRSYPLTVAVGEGLAKKGGVKQVAGLLGEVKAGAVWQGWRLLASLS